MAPDQVTIPAEAEPLLELLDKLTDSARATGIDDGIVALALEDRARRARRRAEGN